MDSTTLFLLTVLTVLFFMICPLINRALIKPMRLRRHLRQYPNVYVDNGAISLIGDALNAMHNIEVEKSTFLYRH